MLWRSVTCLLRWTLQVWVYLSPTPPRVYRLKLKQAGATGKKQEATYLSVMLVPLQCYAKARVNSVDQSPRKQSDFPRETMRNSFQSGSASVSSAWKHLISISCCNVMNKARFELCKKLRWSAVRCCVKFLTHVGVAWKCMLCWNIREFAEKNVTTFAVMIFQYSETDTQNQNNLEMSSSEILQQKQFR